MAHSSGDDAAVHDHTGHDHTGDVDGRHAGGPVRVALVGTGGIAGAHARALTDSPEHEIVAAVDLDPDRLGQFCDQWQIPRSSTDLTTLLAPDDRAVDIVHLCTPPGAHAGPAVAALAAGVDVLCEKPPAMSLAEVDAIIAAERQSPAQFATVFQHRFGSAGQRAIGLMAAGALGRPHVAVCNTLWYRPDAYFDPQWRGVWASEGGGPTLGHGIHQLDLLLALLGPWQRVTAVARRQARPTNTEDLSAAIVEFDNGAVATVINSLLSPRESSYIRIDCEQASVEVEHTYGYGDDNWRCTSVEGTVPAEWGGGPTGIGSSHAAQFAAVAHALRAGLPLPVPSRQARLTMELVTAIYASAFGGHSVERGAIDESSEFYTALDGGRTPWPDVKERH